MPSWWILLFPLVVVCNTWAPNYVGAPQIRMLKCRGMGQLRLRGGIGEEEGSEEARVLQAMGLGGSSEVHEGGKESVFASSLINGTMPATEDDNFTSLLSGNETTEPQIVIVNVYDLAIGGTRNLSQWYPKFPRLSGFWQLGVCVHEMEWTFCAHRGVCGEPSDQDTGYGDPMCSISVGKTHVSKADLRSTLLGLRSQFAAESFDAWTRTSIDFAEALVLLLTGRTLPRQVTVPIPLYVEDDEMEMSDVASHNVTVNISHFPSKLPREIAFRLGDIFRLWGKRLPTKMRLGPQYEPIGPYLPSVADGYAEPPPGKLFVGMPPPDWLLALRDRAVEASRQRMRGYLRAMDMLMSPAEVDAAAREVRRIRQQQQQQRDRRPP